jgi:thymidylate synthase
MELIVAVDRNYGMGINNQIPWKNKEELKLFREKTLNSILIIGRKTVEKLPILESRYIICISRSGPICGMNTVSSILDAKNIANNIDKNKKIFIAGGMEIYKLAIEENWVKRIHISVIRDIYECDTYFDMKLLDNFVIIEKKSYLTFDHYVLEKFYTDERQYLNLLNEILLRGILEEGRNGMTISTFVNHMKFDLRNGFPLLTTKKMFIKGIIEELLFFIRGDTNSKILEEKAVNIWKENTSKEFLEKVNLGEYFEGTMGPMYGYQFRYFNSPYNFKTFEPTEYVCNPKDDNIKCPKFGVDQLQYVINEIKINPKSRRILMTTFNPSQVHQGVLYPCHTITLQFYVEGEYLDMFCYNRSSDVFLGLPFNIASSSLFLMLIAKITNKVPRYFNLSLGDCHIYEAHLEQVKEQIKRFPYKFPNIVLPDVKDLNDIEKLSYNDFILENYQCHASIKAKMIA